jgi:uncharacterized protein YdeI (YjbR/CyaY-like superfamily)
LAPVFVDPNKTHEFPGFESFYQWLSANHVVADEVWIKIHKKASGLPTITAVEAIDVALCWGWIDGIKKSFDDASFLQRYTHRRPKSIWSKVNVANVARLIADGRMTEFGLREVEAAKADGRWDNAYGSGKNFKFPDDLQSAIDANEAAKKMTLQLTEQNRFAFAFRVHNIKNPATRAKKIETFVAMLARGETIYPQKAKP